MVNGKMIVMLFLRDLCTPVLQVVILSWTLTRTKVTNRTVSRCSYRAQGTKP